MHYTAGGVVLDDDLDNGRAATAEFQKLVDHRGIVANFITESLAHLQLGRSYVVADDRARARGRIRISSPLERCRPRHPHLEASQSGVREAARVRHKMSG